MSDPKYLPRDRDGKMFHLIEEMGELNAALGKAGRWGMLSVNPELSSARQETNYAWVLREMTDVEEAIKAFRRDIVAEVDGDDGR